MNETLNERIARCRKLANLTQGEAAERLGMKCSTYSQQERKGNVKSDMLVQLAELYNVDVDYLLFGDAGEPKVDNTSSIFANDRAVIKLNQNTDYFKENMPAAFVITKKEENIIKILRNLPKQSREELIEIIQERYRHK